MQKFVRKLFQSNITIQRKMRAYKFLLQNPGLKIKGSIIDKNVYLKSVDGSSIEIKNSFIGQGTRIIADHSSNIVINDCFIGPNCIIVSRESITIDSDSKIAEMTVIRDHNHLYGKNQKIKDSGFSSSPIFIGKNVWVACKATILEGVTIGDNSVIGGHSLVNKDVDANSLYAGVPAKKLKDFNLD